MQPLRSRIAPTPSGYLHAGNALNFLITQQLARLSGGSVTLRIDDLDATRARAEYVDDIFRSLQWLGLVWDEGPRNADDFFLNWSQRSRLAQAYALLEALLDAGHLYACTCSRKAVPTCSCRQRELPFDGPDTSWRLRVPATCKVDIPELSGGYRTIDLAERMPDPVLRQRSGLPAYQVMSLADDLAMRMTLIVRGEDLLPSSACQLHMATLLGLASYRPVRFLHHPLLYDARGRKLSKSEGADSLRAMRLSGASPDALHAQAAAMLAQFRTGTTM